MNGIRGLMMVDDDTSDDAEFEMEIRQGLEDPHERLPAEPHTVCAFLLRLLDKARAERDEARDQINRPTP
jgi:hypothetical protein